MTPLTTDQAWLLWHALGGWMLAATIVDTDYGMRSIKARQGGRCWPDGCHPELPYRHTGTHKNGIVGYNVVGPKFDHEPPVVSVTFGQIERWAASISDDDKAALREVFGGQAAERNRTWGWCRCPYKDTAPNPHTGPCNRYHPTDDEEQHHYAVLAELDDRQDHLVQAALGLTADVPVQLDLFEAS